MARTSKRKVRLESQSLQENVSVKTYMAGIYARLSVDNHDGKEISIETQIEMAKEYLKSHTERLHCMIAIQIWELPGQIFSGVILNG